MATQIKYKLPSPIEFHIFNIVQSSHLAITDNSFLPLLKPKDITPDTNLPAIVPITALRRRSENREKWKVDVFISIYSKIPNLEHCKSQQDIHIEAVDQGHSYESDLLEIIDMLVDPKIVGCYYDFVEDQVFGTSYKADVFSTITEYDKHPFPDQLMTSSVQFTLKGDASCIKCYPRFNREEVIVNLCNT